MLQFLKVTGTALCAVEGNRITDVLSGIRLTHTAAK